ncbi:hypothetical protein Pst134EB_016496 [Puccinia striiformis f. sp. tritici]|nr:hypothetical protein Pst134EB_016496 [Puccinia striiformis f. sp. tritici]
MHSTFPTLESFPTKHDTPSALKRKSVYADTELGTNAGLVHGKIHKPFVNNENQIALEDNTLKAAQSRQMNKQPIESSRLYGSSDQQEDVVGPMKNTETQKLCNFRDWGFVKDNSVIEINNNPQRQENEKIDLEKYTVFSKDIVNHLTLKLNARLSRIQQSQAKVGPRHQVTTRIELVKKFTKCAVFLNLAYLKFFKENGNGQTTVQQIGSFLNFMKNLWQKIEKGEGYLCDNNDFEEKLHKLLSFESSKHRSCPSSAMGIAWNIVELWVQKAANFEPHISLDYHPQMVEIINKIILYSNYDIFPSKIPTKDEVEVI